MIQSSNSEKFERMAQKLQENCQQFDVLNEQLDELIAKVEEDINKSPLTQYRLKQKKVISE
ncbi:MAG: hypothetical protein QNJ08_20565 [Crocosphaera sp.]|nr:hypothetical protein [Crocosphaera sp.]